MKNINKITVTSVLAIAAVGLAAGTANAAPTSSPAAPPANTTISTDILPGVHYTANAADHSVVLSTGVGSLTTLGTQFQLQDGTGKVVAGTQLTTPDHTGALPNAAQTTAPAVTPGPVKTSAPVAAQTQSPLHNVDATDDFNSALSVAATQFGLATGVGTLAGGAIGGIGGCALGAVTAGTIFIITPPATPFAAAAGCVVGAGAGITIGGVAGALLLGVPVGIASGVQMYNVLHAKGEA